jgi:hypothetical protein
MISGLGVAGCGVANSPVCSARTSATVPVVSVKLITTICQRSTKGCEHSSRGSQALIAKRETYNITTKTSFSFFHHIHTECLCHQSWEWCLSWLLTVPDSPHVRRWLTHLGIVPHQCSYRVAIFIVDFRHGSDVARQQLCCGAKDSSCCGARTALVTAGDSCLDIHCYVFWNLKW